MTDSSIQPCPVCQRPTHTGRSWWAHAITHTHLNRRTHRWVTTDPYWRWDYIPLLATTGPAQWLERTAATPGAPSQYIAHRTTTAGHHQSLPLAVTGIQAAKAEAASLFALSDWAPILSLQPPAAA